MVTVVSRKKPRSLKNSYTLPILKSAPQLQVEKELDYTIKLKRIPFCAELTVSESEITNLYKWTWYETEIE